MNAKTAGKHPKESIGAMEQGIASFRLPAVGSVGVAGDKLATAMLAYH
jgi:hypothetical protein